MHISPIDISIHLDTRHKFEDVQKFIFGEALNGIFQPIYEWKPNQTLQPFDGEKLDTDFKVTTIDVELYKDRNFQSVIKEREKGFYQNLTLCGSYKVNTNDNKNSDIFNFLLPTIGEEDNKLILDFRTLDPALRVDLVYYEDEFSPEPVFYVSIKASQGLWGNRHKWLRGMLEIIEEQVNDEDLSKEWEKDIRFIEDLKEWSEKIKIFERESFLLEDARQKVWDLARGIREKFSESEYATYISPKISPRIDRPADLATFRRGKLPEHVGNIPEDYWIKLAWNECFDWNAPEQLQNRVISYWSTHGDDETFQDIISIGSIGWKGSWPAIVETITKRPETPRMIERLCSFTADINWPGAGEAWEHLYNVVGMRAIPIIDEKIAWAKKTKDDWWEETLRYIKSDILEKYGKK